MLLAERMRNKEKLIGMHVEMTDIASAKIAGLAGYDYVWVDTEHACMSTKRCWGTLSPCKRPARRRSCAPRRMI